MPWRFRVDETNRVEFYKDGVLAGIDKARESVVLAHGAGMGICKVLNDQQMEELPCGLLQ